MKKEGPLNNELAPPLISARQANDERAPNDESSLSFSSDPLVSWRAMIDLKPLFERAEHGNQLAQGCWFHEVGGAAQVRGPLYILVAQGSCQHDKGN